jgi:hypothetical protein
MMSVQISLNCVHGKRKSRCIPCKGSEICEHNKQKYTCKICKGSGICEHNKIKQSCKKCKGIAICKHDKNEFLCKQSIKYGICEHNKQKQYCRQCGGSGLCIHGKQRARCYECKGSQICEHNKRKEFCRDCKGSNICVHNKHKQFCRYCGGARLCRNEWCETTGNKKYDHFCMSCYVNDPNNIDKPIICNYKTKEREVVDRIQESFENFTWVADKRVQYGCSRRRPDLLLDMGSHVIIVEIDENKHSSYDCSCENKRLMQLSLDLFHRPIVFIRFNPDSYVNSEGKKISSCWKLNKFGVMNIIKTKKEEWEHRIVCLKQQIQFWIDNELSKTVEIIELFY